MKCTVVLSALILSLIVVCNAVDDRELFTQFVQKYKKIYTADEIETRFLNFQASLKRIEEKILFEEHNME